MTVVGKSVIRQDVYNYVTGKIAYLDDLNMRTLYAGFVRSPYPHALIKSIDVSDALKTPGIVAVFTGREINKVIKEPIKIMPTYPPLPWKIAKWIFAENEVKYVGEPVALVVGFDKYSVRDAIDRVNVDYEQLDYVIDIREAKKDKVLVHKELSTNIAFGMTFKSGNPEESFKKAERTAEVRLFHDRLSPSPMEPRGIISTYSNGYLTVYMTTQSAHMMKYEFSRIFGIPSSKVRVIVPAVGGGFGSKLTLTIEDIATIASSIILNNTVKWVATRSEELLVQARKFDFNGTIAFNKDGTLLGVKGTVDFDLGAYVTYAEPVVPLLTISAFPNGYRIKDIEILVNAIYTNTPPIHVFRGAGKPEGVMLMEKIMNVIADELKMDEAEVRLKNLVSSSEMPYTNPFGTVYDTGDYKGHLLEGVKKLEYYTWKKWAEEQKREGRKVGVGLAFYVELTALERWEYVETRLTETGDVLVLIGSSPHGQGTETGIAQLVADELQIDISKVRVIWGDTDVVKAGVGTFASRTLTVTGSAAIIASKSLLEKIRNIAAKLLKVDPIEVEYSNGVFQSRNDPNKRITWDEIAKNAVLQFGDISANAQVDAIPTAPYGVHMMVVEVDDFGKVNVIHAMGYDDIGKVINPALAEAQIHGGFVQALGEAVYERIVITENGQISTTFADYYIPTTVESPNRIASLFAEKPHLSNYPSGTKGVGEAGIVGGIMAYLRAIENATGKKIDKIPISPEDLIR